MKNPLRSGAEDFISFLPKEGEGIPLKSSRSKKNAKRELFARVKERLVMCVYGVSRERALEIIKKRREEIRERKRDERKHKDDMDCDTDEFEFTSAEDFFNSMD